MRAPFSGGAKMVDEDVSIHAPLLEVAQSWVEITVVDDGEGMSPDAVKKLFRPFSCAGPQHPFTHCAMYGGFAAQKVSSAFAYRLGSGSSLAVLRTFHTRQNV
jgi:hypothetical protein